MLLIVRYTVIVALLSLLPVLSSTYLEYNNGSAILHEFIYTMITTTNSNNA